MTTIDHETLRSLIGVHLERYAVNANLLSADLASTRAGEGTVCIAEELLWERTAFDVDDPPSVRQSIASLMFAEGFDVALRLAAIVANSPLSSDMRAIAGALKTARKSIGEAAHDIRLADDRALMRAEGDRILAARQAWAAEHGPIPG